MIRFAAVAIFTCAVVSAQQTPAPPTGPLAPEVYKNIQVLKDVPADQLELAMRFVSAALGMQCVNCHVQDATTGAWDFAKDDKRGKQTAREMMKMVKTINTESFNGQNRITCATCHAGRNQPSPRPPLAEMATPDQIAAANQPARQGGAPPASAPGAVPAGQAGAAGGGRGQQGPPPVPVDDVVNKYIDASGGRAALEKLQSLVIAGNWTGRLGRVMPFTIEQKGPGMYRETLQAPEGTVIRVYDGKTGWLQVGGGAPDELKGFSLQQALRTADLGLPLRLKDGYQGLATRRGTTRLNGKDTIVMTGRPATGVTETLYFDSDSGLLVRRSIATTTPLGQLVEQVDYTDYKDVVGVKLPFTIVRTGWSNLDTLRIVDVKPNAQVSDGIFAKPKG